MLYLITHGYKGVEQRSQEDIVFLISTFDEIKNAGLEFVFTNMNAKLRLAEFYNDERDFDNIRWDVVKSRYWHNDDTDIARQDFKQAEFLVRNHVPAAYLTALVVKTEERKAHFERLLANSELRIEVYVDNNSKLYY